MRDKGCCRSCYCGGLERSTHGLSRYVSRCGPHLILCPALLPPLKEQEEKAERSSGGVEESGEEKWRWERDKGGGVQVENHSCRWTSLLCETHKMLFLVCLCVCGRFSIRIEFAPAVAINFNSPKNWHRQQEGGGTKHQRFSEISQKQMCVVMKWWVAVKPFWKISIWHNVCDSMVFERTNNASFRVQLYLLCCSYLSNVLLFTHVERMSSNQCPFLYRLKCTLGFDKWAGIDIYCLVPEHSRLQNDSNNKNSMLWLCYGKRSNIPSSWCDMVIISFVHNCHGEICVWQDVTRSF